MTSIISGVSVPQAAAAINAAIGFVQLTIPLSLVALLIYFMPKTSTAITWSLISKTLGSSIWPTILRADSSSSQTSGAVVSAVSRLTLVTTILVAITGVLLPLGLSEGPLMPTDYRQINAEYFPDNSPLALSTTLNRARFTYGRLCGVQRGLGPTIPCPGNNDPATSAFAPSITEMFNSTPHGPFTMQYRWFFTAYLSPSDNRTTPFDVPIAQSFIMRNDTFATDGVIVDMSPTHPGIGLWNQTLPKLLNGGTWSQDLLWLEPVTRCINTNLTFDYNLGEGGISSSAEDLTITDHGGFINLTDKIPTPSRNGQHVNLIEHAYTGAVLSNGFAMRALNTTRQSSFMGASHRLNTNAFSPNNSIVWGSLVGNMNPLPIPYLNYGADDSGDGIVQCQGYGREAMADGTSVNVECGIFLGPPRRIDFGDPRDYGPLSRWSQEIHSCASATRASIQTVNFSMRNGTTDLQDLKITRTLSGLNVLWATEKTNLTIADLDILWGRVDDRYENDPSLRTVRADGLYLPASFQFTGGILPPGFPPVGHVAMWTRVYLPSHSQYGNAQKPTMDYSGGSDFSIRLKFQSLVAQDPENGNAQIRNLVWTDQMANNFIGTQTNDTLWVAEHKKSIQYDFRYAIPGFVLLLIWTPSFLTAVFLLITRSLTFGYMKKVINHTSVGRVVIGASNLRIQDQDGDQSSFVRFDSDSPFTSLGDDLDVSGRSRTRSGWGLTTPVILELGHRDEEYEDHCNVLEPLNRG